MVLETDGSWLHKAEVLSFALVAIPVPLGQAFSYAIPEPLQLRVEPGARVLCPFGRRKLVGVVLEVQQSVDFDASKIKPVLDVVDEQPALSSELLSFLRQLSDYYLAPIGETLRLALPSLERSQVQKLKAQDVKKVHGVGRMQLFACRIPSSTAEGPVRGQGREILRRLESQDLSVAELQEEFSNARAAVRRLETLGLVRTEKRAVRRDLFFGSPVQRDTPKTLNDEQSVAVASIVAALRSDASRTFLLHGVTGSGKTEIYLHAVGECLAREQGAIVLVPEIALTPQLVGRFRARFGDQIAVLHSALSDGERLAMWQRLRSAELRVAVGARSALFAPVQNLALICVDEEHDSSFKQEEGVRYSARDMAMLRAHRAQAVCVLGSATPSLATESLVRKGRLERLRLSKRAHTQALLPTVEVVNLRTTGAGPSGHRLLSLPLHRRLEETLAQGKQAILFLNRRGFAPSLVCGACGHTVECPNCSVALTVHARGEQLRCHYCDYQSLVARSCDKCRASRFNETGIGTEGIELSLTQTFPQARVARLDRDVAEGLKSEAILDRMREGMIDVLVGTQMVTKGHDLPDVALVGVLNADAALSLPDFQASERTFQLLVQVAGRAGRGSTPGHVIVQTRNPEHPTIRFALGHDVGGFVEHELKERREAHYPPFRRLIMIRVDSLVDTIARQTCAQAAALARQHGGQELEVLGPAAAPIERIRNRFRHRCILRSKQRQPLYRAAKALRQLKLDRRVRLHVDVDPVSML